MRSIPSGLRALSRLKDALSSAIRGCHCTSFSTGEPTYWPADQHRIPDWLDFFVARGVVAYYVRIESVFEISSDHSPIIANIGAQVFPRVVPPHSSHIILTGMYFGPILLTTSTSIYESNNAVSYMIQQLF